MDSNKNLHRPFPIDGMEIYVCHFIGCKTLSSTVAIKLTWLVPWNADSFVSLLRTIMKIDRDLAVWFIQGSG